MSGKTFFVTTPIYYVNDKPHIGHVYTTIVADVISRYKRLCGYDSYFLTGTDEHGQKIERAAKKQGLQPKELADSVVSQYHSLWKKLNITHNDFIRTTEDRHRKAVEKIYAGMKANGDIYLGKYEGWYCTGCEAFFPENQVVDGKCAEHGHPVERLEEESYFFRLSAFGEKLLEHYEKNPDFIKPESRRNEVISFVKSGLQDLSISRTSFKWGIPVPEAEGHILYVWLDALTNYISALGYGTDGAQFEKYWPADLHLMGKDIIRFHAVYWPAFLMSAGVELPRTIFAHGWWMKDDSKMSKSTGNVINPVHLIDDFGADPLRYFLLRDMVFGNDGSFSDEAFLKRINSDLANDLGNLLKRTLTIVSKNCEGKFSKGNAPDELKDSFLKSFTAFRENFDNYNFSEGLRDIWGFISGINKYFDSREPWKLAGDADKKDELSSVLYNAGEGLRLTALMLSPVMPGFAKEIYHQLGLAEDPCALDFENHCRWGEIPGGLMIRKGEPMFQRIDIEKYLGKDAKKVEERKEPESSAISIDDFMKVKLRVARVLTSESIEGAKKLLKLTVDLGYETRTVVAGVAEVYRPEELVDRRVIIVENLKPAVLFGVESKGMVLAAVDEKGKPRVVSAPDNVPLGATVR